jgi:hypothetical protein
MLESNPIMARSFDVGLNSLSSVRQGTALAVPKDATEEGVSTPEVRSSNGAPTKSFYLETFGCKMNDLDSEKVSGILLGRG